MNYKILSYSIIIESDSHRYEIRYETGYGSIIISEILADGTLDYVYDQVTRTFLERLSVDWLVKYGI
jgi:hypothetical protein